MNKKKIQREIEYWSKHLELDKFNYEAELSAFIGILSITFTMAIGLLAIIMTYEGVSSKTKLIIILIVGLIFLYFLKYKLIKNHLKKLNQHKLSFFIRERMLQERYEKLYKLSKDNLDKEFSDLKKIYTNPKKSLRTLLVKQYYENN